MENYEKELIKIKEILKENLQGLTISEIAEKLDHNRNSVAKYVDLLNISGELEKREVGPAKIFSLSKRVPLSSMLDQSKDTLTLLDENFYVLEMNNAIANLIGKKKEELIGTDVFKSMLTDSQEVMDEMREVLKEVLNGKERILEKTIEVGGKEMHRYTQLIPTTLGDGSKGITVIGKDMTKQKETEKALKDTQEKMRATLEALEDLIFVLNKKGDFIEFYQPNKKNLLFPPEEFLNKNYKELFSPEISKNMEETIKALMDTQKSQKMKYSLPVNGQSKEFEATFSIRRDGVDDIVILSREL